MTSTTAHDLIEAQTPIVLALMACQPFDVDIRLTGGNASAAIVIADPRNDRWEVLLTNGDADLPVQVDGSMPTVLVARIVDGADDAHRRFEGPVTLQDIGAAVRDLMADVPEPTGHLPED